MESMQRAAAKPVTAKKAKTKTKTKTSDTKKKPATHKSPPKAPTPQRPPLGLAKDGFDDPVAPKLAGVAPACSMGSSRVEASASLLKSGQARVASDRQAPKSALMSAAMLLGGLTAGVVLNVLQQFQSGQGLATPAGQELGELTSALFVEFLSRVAPSATGNSAAKASAPWDAIANTRLGDFSQRFESSFGMSPFEAAGRFVDFIGGTEGHPGRRLEGTVYAGLPPL